MPISLFGVLDHVKMVLSSTLTKTKCLFLFVRQKLYYQVGKPFVPLSPRRKDLKNISIILSKEVLPIIHGPSHHYGHEHRAKLTFPSDTCTSSRAVPLELAWESACPSSGFPMFTHTLQSHLFKPQRSCLSDLSLAPHAGFLCAFKTRGQWIGFC